MIGFVIVSHSAKLAEGVCELAGQVAQGRVRLAAAGGTADAENPIGTDAYKVLQAIESVYTEDGVLVLTDLGSADLSAETALELLAEDKRAHVHLCPDRWWKQPCRRSAWRRPERASQRSCVGRPRRKRP